MSLIKNYVCLWTYTLSEHVKSGIKPNSSKVRPFEQCKGNLLNNAIDKRQHKACYKSAFISYLPKFDGFIVCREKEKGAISYLAPSDFVDFLFYLQTLKVVKLKQLSHVISVGYSKTYDVGGTLPGKWLLPRARDSETLFCNGIQDACWSNNPSFLNPF